MKAKMNFDEHVAFRLEQANKNSQNDKFGLCQIEINPTELCNRTCNFCPRAHGYPNLDLHLSVDDTKILKDRLIEYNYKGILIISGTGEPLLNKNILSIIAELSGWWLELITNGDVLLKKPDLLDQMFDRGLTRIIIDEYDNFTNYEKKLKMIEGKEGTVKEHISNKHNYNNRAGAIQTTENSLFRQCYFPFYKGVIDIGLEFRFCCNDWKYKTSIGNLKNNTIEEIWMSDKMNNYRKLLAQGKRNCIEACSKCDANGLLVGKASFDKLINFI